MTAEKKSWLSQLMGGEADNKKSKFYWMILLVLFGIMIMILSSFLNVSEKVSPTDTKITMNLLLKQQGKLIEVIYQKVLRIMKKTLKIK